jgi:hypothetical protein
MEFNFNTFFGLETILNNNPEIMIFWSFLGVLCLAFFLSAVSYIFRKFNINSYIIECLLWTSAFTFFIGILAIMILFFVATVSGVKLAYIWSSIFIGYLCFSLLYNNALKKLFKDYSLTIKKNRK